MIPYDLDPSLHAARPSGLLLDDGFSANTSIRPEDVPLPGHAPSPANPTHLPIEPEFDQPAVPLDEPESPISNAPISARASVSVSLF